ncbi:MAG: HAMP domain-containing protein [Bacteroidales bacterium]|nr:HAMP domain-containing protein [Bacteroidales bacterium]
MKNFINNLKISHALIAGALIIVAFTVVQNLNSIKNIDKFNNYINIINNKRVKPMKNLNVILDAYTVKIVDAANKVAIQSISWEEGYSIVAAAQKSIKTNWALYISTLNKEESKNQILAFEKIEDKTKRQINRLSQILAGKNEAELESFIKKDLYPAIEPLANQVVRMTEDLQKSIDQISSDTDKLYQSIFSKTRMLGIITMLIIISMMIFLITSIRATLKKANTTIKKIADGDLTVKIVGFGKDEIGELMFGVKGLVRNLRSTMETINNAANSILITSNELSSSSQQISSGATEQAASVEEIAASMEEISANIMQNAKNSQITEKISTQAGEEFESGRENIDTTVKSIQTIASKISIIGDIAFQTNILALNAAVEAARAGEHGKGFGVVAAEVGKLAERSKIAAAEINNLSKTGVEQSLKSKDLLKIALPSINKTIKLIKEISLASNEQSSGVDQINSGIQTLNHVTQQNAAASEQMATVAEELAAQAEQLSNSIRFFNIGSTTKNKIEKKSTAPKYIAEKAKSRPVIKENPKGIDLDLDSKDDLDNEFETF